MRPPKQSPEDEDLFRRAMGGVTPIRDDGRVAPAPAARKPQRLQIDASALSTTADPAVPAADGEAPAEYLTNGLSRLALRKMRRGHYPVQDTLDLHGLDTMAALNLLQDFLQQASHRRLRCLLVIHGKGLHTEGREGILKSRVRNWLIRRTEVMAYCEALPAQGGSGAVLLLLRQPTNVPDSSA